MDLTRYRALSFDCYGTLIDWEAGIAAVLRPWARAVGLDLDDERLLEAYAGNEAAVEREQPAARYPQVLATAFRRTGAALGRTVDDAWARRLGDSVPDWPAFADSPAALASLATHYRLLVVSNVHRDGFAASNRRLRGRFAAVITAEDVGAYKPAANHFQALLGTLDDLGVAPGELLHVAQSLFHDHVPAKRAGLATVWINRRHDRPGWGATPEPSEAWSYDLELRSLAELAAATDAAFARRDAGSRQPASGGSASGRGVRPRDSPGPGEDGTPPLARHSAVTSSSREDVVVQDSERSLVPLPSESAAVRAADGRVDVPRLLAAAALGLAVEAQRRSLATAVAVTARIASPLRILARPVVAVAQGSVTVARHHLDLDRWAVRGLAEQQRAREAATRAVRGVVAALAAAVLDEIDLDQVMARVNLDQVVARVDLDRILDRIDANEIAARIDLDEIVDRVDVDAIARRIDLNAVVSRIDLDAIVARVDLEAILARLDLPGLTEQVIDEVDLGEIIRESSSTMASETVDALRVQGMRVDGLVSRIVDRILLREGQRQTGPTVERPRP